MAETANLHSTYAGEARIGLGGWKGLTKGRIADWVFLEKNGDGGARER